MIDNNPCLGYCQLMSESNFLKSILLKRSKLSSKFYLFEFKFIDGKVSKFKPGQFITLKVGKYIFRCYSIFSLSDKLPFWQIFVDITPGGPGTTYLKNLKVGETVHTTAPTGSFTPRNDSSKYIIMVATGCGIAPLKPMIDYYLSLNKVPKKILFYWGMKNQNEVVLKDVLSKWTKTSQFDYHLCYFHSILSELHKDLSQIPKKETSVYIAGNGSFIKEAISYLESNKFPLDKVYFEQCYFSVQ